MPSVDHLGHLAHNHHWIGLAVAFGIVDARLSHWAVAIAMSGQNPSTP